MEITFSTLTHPEVNWHIWLCYWQICN